MTQPIKPDTQLASMLMLAAQRHDGQFDKGGKPYILHPLKVMHYLKTEDMELCCIALGHDLIEDTYPSVETGAEALRARGFSHRIVEGILAMTKRKGQSYDEYRAQVKANPDAVKVKMADLRHNSDLRRIKGVTPKDFERNARYHTFYLELKNECESAN